MKNIPRPSFITLTVFVVVATILHLDNVYSYSDQNVMHQNIALEKESRRRLMPKPKPKHPNNQPKEGDHSDSTGNTGGSASSSNGGNGESTTTTNSSSSSSSISSSSESNHSSSSSNSGSNDSSVTSSDSSNNDSNNNDSSNNDSNNNASTNNSSNGNSNSSTNDNYSDIDNDVSTTYNDANEEKSAAQSTLPRNHVILLIASLIAGAAALTAVVITRNSIRATEAQEPQEIPYLAPDYGDMYDDTA